MDGGGGEGVCFNEALGPNREGTGSKKYQNIQGFPQKNVVYIDWGEGGGAATTMKRLVQTRTERIKHACALD